MGNLNRFQKRIFITLFICLSLFVLASGVYAQTDTINPEIAVFPAALDQISWGAILAGTIIAIVIQLAGNLLAVGIGVNRINPNPHYGEETALPEDIGAGTIIMIAFTVLLSLFIGGYIAARFSGSTNQQDALLHGVMVWGLDSVITLFLLTTTLGKIFSGLSGLLGQGLQLVGSATSAVAQGAATVVQGAASVAGTMTGMVGESVKNVAGFVGETAKDAAGTAQDAAQNVIQSDPDLQKLSGERDALMQRMQSEAMKLVNEAGVDPSSMKDEAQNAMQGAKDTISTAAQEIQQNPVDIQAIVAEALNKLFQDGLQVAGQVEAQVSQLDRNNLIELLASRGNMNREQAEQQIVKWEGEYKHLRQQGEQALKQARHKGEQTLRDAGVEAERLQTEAKMKLEQVRKDTERKAREVAEATTQLISRLALAGFAILLIGAIAGGLGGIAGTQEAAPALALEVDNDTTMLPNAMLVPSQTPMATVTNTP